MSERELNSPQPMLTRWPIGASCKGLKAHTFIPKSISSPLLYTVLTWFITWLRNSHPSDGVIGNITWCFLPDTLSVRNKQLHFLSAVSPPSPWPITLPKITSLIHWKDFCGYKYVFNVLWLPDLKIWRLLGSMPEWSHLSLLCLILFHLFNKKSQAGNGLKWKCNVNMHFQYQSLSLDHVWSDILYDKWMSSCITTFLYKTYTHFQALTMYCKEQTSKQMISILYDKCIKKCRVCPYRKCHFQGDNSNCCKSTATVEGESGWEGAELPTSDANRDEP